MTPEQLKALMEWARTEITFQAAVDARDVASSADHATREEAQERLNLVGRATRQRRAVLYGTFGFSVGVNGEPVKSCGACGVCGGSGKIRKAVPPIRSTTKVPPEQALEYAPIAYIEKPCFACEGSGYGRSVKS